MKVDVGTSDVHINQIGTYGGANTGFGELRIKWLVFDNTDLENPILQTSGRTLNQTVLEWKDSPQFSPLRLKANETYWVGYVLDTNPGIPREWFKTGYRLPGTPVTREGLTIDAGQNGVVFK